MLRSQLATGIHLNSEVAMLQLQGEEMQSKP